MLTTPIREQVSRYLSYAGFGATIAIAPWTNLDPVNIVKMVVLVIFGFISLGHLLPLAKEIWAGPYKLIISLVAAFILQMLIAMAFDNTPFYQQFFGTFGRNTGFLSYLALSIILLVAAIVVGRKQGRRIVLALLFAGSFNAIYGYFQSQGQDPIPWANEYNFVIGTLGNPNFAAAVLGFTTVVSAAILFGNEIKPGYRAAAFAMAVLSFMMAIETASTQGPIVALIGCTVVGYQFVAKTLNWKWARLPYIGLVAFSGILGVLGTLQRGPLKGILYQESVTYRGDYWRAGIHMTMDSPLTGIGLDSYGDYYRTSRTMAAAERRGPEVVANSAHNVFFDISSNGGVPMLLIYLAMIGFAAFAAYRILSRNSKYEWVSVAMISVWVAYLAQSAISINQLGVAVWGWLLPGSIIGLYLNEKVSETPVKDLRGRRIYAPPKYLLTGMAFGVIGVVISMWPLRYDSGVRYALGSGDSQKIISSVRAFPINDYHLLTAAKTMIDKKDYEKALALYRQAYAINPRNYYAIRGMITFPEITGAERANYIAQLRALDPYNNTIPNN